MNGVRDQPKRSRFIVHWCENNEKCSKPFVYGFLSKLSRAEAFQKAIEFRDEKNIEIGCTNGKRGADIEKAVADMKAEQYQYKINKSNKTGFNGIFERIDPRTSTSAYVVAWKDNEGKPRQKLFSFGPKSFPKQRALEEAVKFRMSIDRANGDTKLVSIAEAALKEMLEKRAAENSNRVNPFERYFMSKQQ